MMSEWACGYETKVLNSIWSDGGWLAGATKGVRSLGLVLVYLFLQLLYVYPGWRCWFLA